MIPTEIITFTVSIAIGAWIKLKAKQIEAQQHQADLWARPAHRESSTRRAGCFDV